MGVKNLPTLGHSICLGLRSEQSWTEGTKVGDATITLTYAPLPFWQKLHKLCTFHTVGVQYLFVVMSNFLLEFVYPQHCAGKTKPMNINLKKIKDVVHLV